MALRLSKNPYEILVSGDHGQACLAQETVKQLPGSVVVVKVGEGA